MTLIQKLQRLPQAELEIIEELFDSITHETVIDIYRNLMHSRSECFRGAAAFMRLQEMDDEPETTAAQVEARINPDASLTSDMMLRLAYRALCENEHATVPGITGYPAPFHDNYDTTRLLQAMEKQLIHLPHGE
jgi:hypothetical protein